MTHAQQGLFWSGAALMVHIGPPNTKWIMLSLATYSFIRAIVSDD